jgi:DNA-binding MarR family transcriptional regulator
MTRRDALRELKGRADLPPEQQAFLNLVRTSDHLLSGAAALLRGHGITEPQYNVLRILRGAGPDGLPSGAIAPRMLTRGPDVTRLVDRLEAGGLAFRERGSGPDRRCVVVRITEEGRSLLARLDEPVRNVHRLQFQALDPEELRELKRLLVKLRGEEREDAHETTGE